MHVRKRRGSRQSLLNTDGNPQPKKISPPPGVDTLWFRFREVSPHFDPYEDASITVAGVIYISIMPKNNGRPGSFI